MNSKRIFPLCILLIITFLPVSVFAHRVNLFAYIERGEVYTESYFSDGQPAQGNIKVFDDQDKLLLENKNDKEGLFHFPLPHQVKALRFVLSAPMGHRCSYTLTVSPQREEVKK